MALEDIEGAGKYLGSLNPSNPASGDDRREGDNHIRGVKNTLRNTFPNVNAEVTATAAQLDDCVQIDGIASDLDTAEANIAANTAAIATKVNKAGDTMTGNLALQATIPTIALVYGGIAEWDIRGETSGSLTVSRAGGPQGAFSIDFNGKLYSSGEEIGWKRMPRVDITGGWVITSQHNGMMLLAPNGTTAYLDGNAVGGDLFCVFGDGALAQVIAQNGVYFNVVGSTAAYSIIQIPQHGVATFWMTNSQQCIVGGDYTVAG